MSGQLQRTAVGSTNSTPLDGPAEFFRAPSLPRGPADCCMLPFAGQDQRATDHRSVRWSAAILRQEHGRENIDDFTGFKNAVRRTMVGTIVSWRYLKQGKRRKSEGTPFLAGRLMIGGQDGWKDEGGSWMARLSRVISKNKGEAWPRERAAGNGRLRGRREEETAREHQIKSK